MKKYIDFLSAYMNSPRVEFLASDMSNRTYYRVFDHAKTYVLMDTPDQEELKRFISLSTLLYDKGIKTPKLFYHDIDAGLLVMEDFGDHTLTKTFQKSTANEIDYLKKAIDILHALYERFQQKPESISDYDTNKLIQEVNIFSDYYFPYVHERTMDQNTKNEFIELWKKAFDQVSLLTPRTLVLRDYHVDNLIVLKDDQLGILDYQDALWGSITYDFISLIEDARRDLKEAFAKKITEHFLRVFDSSVHQDYLYAADILGAGRHAKVLGVFARYATIRKNDSKICHLPRTLNYLFRSLERTGQSEILYFLKDQGFSNLH